MEKEVKKKRVTKKTKEEKAVEEKAAVQDTAENPKKAVKKPRAKKAEKVETPAVPAEAKVEESKIEESAPAREEEKKPKKPRAKKTVKKEDKTDVIVTELPREEKKLAPEKPVEKEAEKPAVEKHELTRQEKKDAVRAIVKELLQASPLRRTALIDEASKLYVERFPSAENANVNDVKGRVGSVITLMEQGAEIFPDGNVIGLEKPKAKEEKKPEEPVPAPMEEKHLPVPVSEGKLAPVFDMSALLGEKKPEKPAEKAEEQKTAKKVEKAKGVKAIPEKITVKKLPKPKTDDKLKERFLKKIRSHGGSYLEYYAVYLLQRYAQSNGRRLEGMRVSGGEYDGGIDGEIELTDKFGFRETLYIQAKNWEPTDEKWMVGETLLQQFIGAVTYRLRKAGKGNGRGVYVTTSKFSEGAKKILDEMSDSFVGYDGDELFELAKECNFGVLKKDGEWVLDENLLSGEKAFFNM
ncbi:MAG: restriction endonuclease [Clostridia bacterium]|nr:restriction endonuclease [Clostridia bacterium]